MKAKILLLAIAIMGTSIVFSQPATAPEAKNDCEQKTLRKIKRKLNLIKVSDYLAEGQKAKLIVTCTVNDEKNVEVLHVEGYDEELKAEIMNTLKEHPVKCENTASGEEFSFWLTLICRPA